MPAGQFRHGDHRFEWTRTQFQTWANGVAERFQYKVRFEPIGLGDDVRYNRASDYRGKALVVYGHTPVLLATPFRVVDLNDAVSCDAAVAWWTEMTSHGREGMDWVEDLFAAPLPEAERVLIVRGTDSSLRERLDARRGEHASKGILVP